MRISHPGQTAQCCILLNVPILIKVCVIVQCVCVTWPVCVFYAQCHTSAFRTINPETCVHISLDKLLKAFFFHLMTEIYNKETLNHDYPIISCLKRFNFCLKGEKSSLLIFPIYSSFHKWTATMMMMVMGSTKVRFCVSLSSLLPNSAGIYQGIILSGIRSGQHADKEGK